MALVRPTPLRLPQVRGALSCHALNVVLGNRPGGPVAFGPEPDSDPLDEDLQLALHVCYHRQELGPGGDDGGVESWLARLESAVVDRLRHLVPPPRAPEGDAVAATAEVRRLVDGAALPSVAGWAAEHAPCADRELAVHRSIPPGSPAVDLGVDPDSVVDQLPSATLAMGNIPLLLARDRRWRGALGGYRAATELLAASRLMDDAAWLERLGVTGGGPDVGPLVQMTDRRHLAGELLAEVLDWEPELAGDARWGAQVAVLVERRFTDHVLGCWRRGETSLRCPG